MCSARSKQVLRRPLESALATLIAMMNDIDRLALADCHLERVQHQFGAQVVGHRPADDLAAEGVQDHGQVQETGCSRHESNVSNP